MTTKELIREKIDSFYAEYKAKFHQNGEPYNLGIIDGLDMAERILDTLPDESVTDCHDLEEAAEKSARQYYVDGGYSPFPNTEMASHIAGFKAGAEWMKTKMMEGAVEGEVCILPGHVAYVKEKNNESLKQYILDNFKAGDEVRIIILPKEG